MSSSVILQKIDQFGEAVVDMRKELVERIEVLEAGRDRPRGPASATPEVKAFSNFVQTGDRSGLEEIQKKEMSIAGGAAAGQALVPEQIANEIISRAIARSPLVGLVRQTNAASGDYVRLLNLRGATASWSAEAGTRSGTSTPLLREIRPTSGELFGLPTVTRWLIEDSKFNVDAFLRENVADTFAKSLEAAILNGDGSNKPTGILNSTPTTADDDASPQRAADVIEYIATSGDVANDLIELYFTLKPEYRRNAVFVMSSATLAAVRKLRDSNGSGFLWQANLSGAVDAGDGTLLGKRVITSEELPTIGASPVVDGVLCGDFDVGYELVRIGPMTLIRDDISVKGKVSFYTAQRFGGRLVDNDAIKALRA
jgi:HK97 family phage major capsid protein